MGDLAGKLKERWQLVKFGDVVKLSNARCSNPESKGIERYVGLEHIDSDDLRIRRWGMVEDGITFTTLFRPGQVLFGKRRAYLRKVAVADFEGVCSGDIYVFESANPEVLMPELLPFICQTDRFFEYAIGTSAGSLSPRTNWKSLANFEFALPSLEEQNRISSIFSATENVICLLQDTIEKAFKLWRSLSKEEFNKPSFHENDYLDKHYSVVGGQVDPKDSRYIDLPLIAPNHIQSGTGEIIELISTKEQEAISGKYFFNEGSVIYSKIRPELIKATIAPCSGLCSADMYALIPKQTLRKEYLLEILLSDSFTQFAISGSKRTGIPKLNRTHLAQYSCNVPDLQKQQSYLNKVFPVHKSRESLLKRTHESKAIKKAFLDELLK
jgi:type I restriction enzyme S subunit